MFLILTVGLFESRLQNHNPTPFPFLQTFPEEFYHRPPSIFNPTRSDTQVHCISPPQTPRAHVYHHQQQTDSHPIPYAHSGSSRPQAVNCKPFFPCGPEVLVGLEQHRRSQLAVVTPGVRQSIVYEPYPPPLRVYQEIFNTDRPPRSTSSISHSKEISELQRQLTSTTLPSHSNPSEAKNSDHDYSQPRDPEYTPEITITPLSQENIDYTIRITDSQTPSRIPVDHWNPTVYRSNGLIADLPMESQTTATGESLVRNRRALMQSTPRRLIVRDDGSNPQQNPILPPPTGNSPNVGTLPSGTLRIKKETVMDTASSAEVIRFKTHFACSTSNVKLSCVSFLHM
jgi:hypothetical protein